MVKRRFFTMAAGVIATIAFILGVLGALMGLGVATGVVVEPEPGVYLGSKSSGEAIDRGIYYMVVAVVLGVLAEISQSLVVSQGNGKGGE